MEEVDVGSIMLRECLNSYIRLLQIYSKEIGRPGTDFYAITKQTRAAAARINALLERCTVEAESEEVRKKYPINIFNK